MKEVMVHIYRKIKQISSPFFCSFCLVTFKKSRGHLPLVTSGYYQDHSFPVSLSLPRWQPCQIPNPGAMLKCQNPYPGEGMLSQFPVGSPPPPPTLGLNIDRCITLFDLTCLSSKKIQTLKSSFLMQLYI